jgi:hypothetical protein
VPAIVNQVITSPGFSLDAKTRLEVEERLGYDFGSIRIHTDAKANLSADALNARAYTAGQHIVFGAGEFAPWTPRGRYVLSHELVHTIQQGRSGAQIPSEVARDDAPAEVEAARIATAAEMRASGAKPVHRLGRRVAVSTPVLQHSSTATLHRLPCLSNPSLSQTRPHLLAEAWFYLGRI